MFVCMCVCVFECVWFRSCHRSNAPYHFYRLCFFCLGAPLIGKSGCHWPPGIRLSLTPLRWMTNAPQFPDILHGCGRLNLCLRDCMARIFQTGLYPNTSCNLEFIQLGNISACVRGREEWKIMVTSFLRLKSLGEMWFCGKVDLCHYRENRDYAQYRPRYNSHCSLGTVAHSLKQTCKSLSQDS